MKKVPKKKRGHLFLLGEELEMQVGAYFNALIVNGAVVSTSIAIACAEGIVRSKDSNLLASSGGHITLGKHWGHQILSHLGYVKHRASTKAIIISPFRISKE